MALLHLLHCRNELLKPLNAVSALKLWRFILHVVLSLVFQREVLFDVCLKEVTVKEEEGEPNNRKEGNEATDLCQARHDCFWVLLVGVDLARGEVE